MAHTLNLTLTPRQAASEEQWLPIALRQIGCPRSQLALARVVKRSVDARHRTPKVLMTVELYIDGEELPPPVHFDYPNVEHAREVIIVGGGPAGLFAALRFIELGLRPIVLERGKEVGERKKDIARIGRGGEIDPNSNYAFGEGGAGTFSDGKLFTRSKKRGDYNRALQALVFHGAQPEILYEARPHIGTDRLPRIIENVRRTIRECGGEVLFGARVSRIVVRDGAVRGVECADGRRFDSECVVLATGHSARDIYYTLHDSGIRIEAKPFAMGVRIEHPQELIDTIQYHSAEWREVLPAASYSLVAQVGGRGVYSFCMCPGGVIVPAMTDSAECVVNGMSSSARGSRWANSGIVTEIREEDYGYLRAEWGELAALRYQQEMESRARAAGAEGQKAPAQRATDFVAHRRSQSVVRTSYTPGVVCGDMWEWMPRVVAESLRGGLLNFDRRMHGFLTSEATLIGVESRTSTPVRIPRDRESLQHTEVRGLYPTGEGAGYAGGIISAALDGERVAEAAATYLKGIFK
ncbi:MAG: FAD-binding protein [Tidjanibacter sp.]|nr:FAD-binding protein [Tidjanibacter sp.]